MNKRIYLILLISLAIGLNAPRADAQCQNNMGFENGNFTGWNTATDSIYIQPWNRVWSNPGTNSYVVDYGVTDRWLGTIARANPAVGNKLIKVGNSGVRAVADTVYRTYIVDSLSDKLTIYSIGVSQLAHRYWNVPTNESPGFGYEIYINGQQVGCLKGAFFTGNTDTPHVWQLGTYKDTANQVRKSTGWGAETLNLACFVGDTVEVRMFTRDCILLGHYAYAYFDIVCGDTSKPVFSQISVNDIIADDELTLYCTPGATLLLEPQTQVCPIFMGNIIWTPAQFIVGPRGLDSARINVTDSAWIYVEAEFSNFCQTVTIIDSIFVKMLNADPHDNVPKLERNFCDCKSDTLDFSNVPVNTIWDANSNTYNLNNNLLIVNPCDNFAQTAFWKNTSSRIVTNGSTIGTSSWSSGNSEGAIGVDTVLPGSTISYTYTASSTKKFYVGFNDQNSNNNNDMTHYVYVDGNSITAYYGNSNRGNLGSYSGTVTIDFVIASNRRVYIYINGSQVLNYGNSRKANGNGVFPDFSAESNHSPHITSASVTGPTVNEKDFARLINPSTFEYYFDFVDRCGLAVQDTIAFIPGFTAALTGDVIQCGLNPLNLTLTSGSPIDNLTWTSMNAQGSFSAPGNGTPAFSKNLRYFPDPNDYNFVPIAVEITATSGRCIAKDTGYITIREIPLADAGPDITTTLDSFLIGGSPSGSCLSCSSFNMNWSQGTALNDSTIDNPTAFKSRIGAPFFVVTVTDPNTGCFSIDTVEVFTSLSNPASFMQTNCITKQLVDIHWTMLPDPNIQYFGIDYSYDEGRTWISSTKVEASQLMVGVPMPYQISFEKQRRQQTVYRWYTISPSGEKSRMVMLDDLSCAEGDAFTLYPNPFTNAIEIQIDSKGSGRNNFNVQILNQYGQVVHEKSVPYTEVGANTNFLLSGLSQLSSGIYYVSITNNDKVVFKQLLVKSQ